MLRLKKVEEIKAFIHPDGILVVSQGKQQVYVTPDQCASLVKYIQMNIADQKLAWAESEMFESIPEGFEV